MRNFYTYKISFYNEDNKYRELEVKKENLQKFTDFIKAKGYNIIEVKTYYYPKYIITRVLPSDYMKI